MWNIYRPRYVVRREGKVLTRICPSICLSTAGGVSQPTQLGGISPAEGGVSPARGGQSADSAGGGSVQPGGGQSSWGGQSSQGGQSSLGGCQSSWGGSVQPVGGGQSSQRVGGSAKIGQQNEYSLHGGRYASCVHAGGLSCVNITPVQKYYSTQTTNERAMG